MAAVRGTAMRGRLDVRFVLGLLLVLGSVAGVWAVVAGAERTQAVYAAGGPLAVGDRVTGDDLELAAVRLGTAAGHYLEPGDLPVEGVVMTRAVDAGELVPSSAVGAESSLRMASVVVPLGADPAHGVEPGALVDVWSASEAEQGAYGPPAVLVPGAEVVRTIDGRGLLAAGSASAVEVLVPRDRVALLLQALANSDAISLVPVSSPPGDR
ncbi:hypothetical protein [Naasia aerilata]|uniref:SAF domain-containing protein n=1 Tax=Naasia aerilata TaxID=1162966 RepID=A0ABM8GCP4_9MICO|nr:hypothetical protein [Naasia aerilata]BDZ46021.1 hypothetical protein GCM10025866_19300 [Naasia aerilata]